MARKVRDLISKHPRAWLVASYLLLAVVVTLVLVWRFPNNVTHANFYAEDGSVFLQNIIDKGWLSASLTDFNGYFVSGLYLLEGAGWILNSILGDGLLTLPVFFALVSIMFMAAVIALPYLLFSSAFGRIKMLMVVAFSALLPLPLSPHVVIGNIGNQKWVFFYLAFLLVLYWLLNYKRLSWPKLVAINLILLICAYTNSTTYVLIPVLFVPYLKLVWDQRKKLRFLGALWKQLKVKECLGLVALSLLLLPQVIYVALNGIPEQPGYLDTPYDAAKTIEVFVNRTYLFGVTHLLNSYLSDLLALVLFAVLLFAGLYKLKGRQRWAFSLGLYAAFMASVLFVMNRTGVTDFFGGYQAEGSGPDQFFYAQTLIMYLPIVLAAFAIAKWLDKRHVGKVLVGLFAVVVIGTGLASNVVYGERWRNASVFENDAGTFVDQALVACDQQTGQDVQVIVYPYANGQFSLQVPRDQVCASDLKRYQPAVESLGLKPNNNDYKTIYKQADAYQTFVTNQEGLNGVRLFVSTFNNARRDGVYKLSLYDQDCQTIIRIVELPRILLDNTYYNARFEPITNSDSHQYCFALTPPDDKAFDPIALQRSKPDVYLEGGLIENGRQEAKDIVFMPLYTQTRP